MLLLPRSRWDLLTRLGIALGLTSVVFFGGSGETIGFILGLVGFSVALVAGSIYSALWFRERRTLDRFTRSNGV